MEITRRIEFDSGHRVYQHESKCAHLHGHRYVAEITVTSPKLDTLGRVVDFSVLKTEVGGWVDNNWDHNFLVHADDPLRGYLEGGDLHGRWPYVMKHGNPTAENIAHELFEVAVLLLEPYPITVKRVRVYETPNCWADYDGT